MHKIASLLICLVWFSILDARTARIELGGQVVIAEIADRPDRRADGLKSRKHLLENHGMLFIFDNPNIQSFWMKDTLLPLSIAFFDAERILINTADMPLPLPSANAPLGLYRSLAPALYALEMPLHWFKKHGIRPGMKFSFQEPPE